MQELKVIKSKKKNLSFLSILAKAFNFLPILIKYWFLISKTSKEEQPG